MSEANRLEDVDEITRRVMRAEMQHVDAALARIADLSGWSADGAAAHCVHEQRDLGPSLGVIGWKHVIRVDGVAAWTGQWVGDAIDGAHHFVWREEWSEGWR